MNRGTLRGDVISYMDATLSQRWDQAAGAEVDRRIGAVYDSIWHRMLNANPYYRVGKRTPASNSTGRYLLSDLTVGADDTLQRFYRVLGVVIDLYPYDGPVDFSTWAPFELQNISTANRVWYQEGTSLVALPIQASKVADAIWVNYIPQRPDELEGDNSVIEFPDGHEEVLIALSAARLLTKAGAETQAAAEIKAEIRMAYDELIGDISRVANRPSGIAYIDSTSEWGV